MSRQDESLSVIKLEEDIGTQKLLPMPLTQSAHPGERSESSSLAEIYSGGNKAHISNSVIIPRSVCARALGGGKPISIHALAMKKNLF